MLQQMGGEGAKTQNRGSLRGDGVEAKNRAVSKSEDRSCVPVSKTLAWRPLFGPANDPAHLNERPRRLAAESEA